MVYRKPDEPETFVFCFPNGSQQGVASCDRQGLPDLAFMLRCHYPRRGEEVPQFDIKFEGIERRVVERTLSSAHPTYYGPMDYFDRSHADTTYRQKKLA